MDQWPISGRGGATLGGDSLGQNLDLLENVMRMTSVPGPGDAPLCRCQGPLKQKVGWKGLSAHAPKHLRYLEGTEKAMLYMGKPFGFTYSTHREWWCGELDQ